MDYISREDALKKFEDHCYPVKHDMTSIEMGMTLYGIKQVLDECSAADVVERKTGKWKKYGEDLHVCSACHKYWIWATDRYDFKYCPNCGARMEGAE